jgi:hypothetical protein
MCRRVNRAFIASRVSSGWSPTHPHGPTHHHHHHHAWVPSAKMGCRSQAAELNERRHTHTNHRQHIRNLTLSPRNRADTLCPSSQTHQPTHPSASQPLTDSASLASHRFTDGRYRIDAQSHTSTASGPASYTSTALSLAVLWLRAVSYARRAPARRRPHLMLGHLASGSRRRCQARGRRSQQARHDPQVRSTRERARGRQSSSCTTRAR